MSEDFVGVLGDNTEESTELFEHFRIVADKGQALTRVDKFLQNRLENVSRNRVQNAAKAGSILVNDKPVKSNYKVKPLDVVTVVLAYPPREVVITPENIPLQVVYEDDDVIVVNKQAGLVVHPGHGNFDGTLLNALAYHFKENGSKVENGFGYLVHRIDKDTTGLMIVAKNETAQTVLAAQFYEHSITRRYQALVWGDFAEDEGTIEGNIGRSMRDRVAMAVYPDGSQGKDAVTHYKVLERFNYVTLVECRLETGRTHQIRVHLAENGLSIVCDPLYSGNQKPLRLSEIKKNWRGDEEEERPLLKRLGLHAYKIEFTHPKTGEKVSYTAPYPRDMEAVRKQFAKIYGVDSTAV